MSTHAKWSKNHLKTPSISSFFTEITIIRMFGGKDKTEMKRVALQLVENTILLTRICGLIHITLVRMWDRYCSILIWGTIDFHLVARSIIPLGLTNFDLWHSIEKMPCCFIDRTIFSFYTTKSFFGVNIKILVAL